MFLSSEMDQTNANNKTGSFGQENHVRGPTSGGQHKRPKSNLDGFIKNNKLAANSNELPQIEL